MLDRAATDDSTCAADTHGACARLRCRARSAACCNSTVRQIIARHDGDYRRWGHGESVIPLSRADIRRGLRGAGRWAARRGQPEMAAARGAARARRLTSSVAAARCRAWTRRRGHAAAAALAWRESSCRAVRQSRRERACLWPARPPPGAPVVPPCCSSSSTACGTYPYSAHRRHVGDQRVQRQPAPPPARTATGTLPPPIMVTGHVKTYPRTQRATGRAQLAISSC